MAANANNGKPNKIEDLRRHLFSALEALGDKDHPMELDRAKAIAHVSQTIIDSARVEVEFMKVTGATDTTNFIAPALPDGVTVHRLK